MSDVNRVEYNLLNDIAYDPDLKKLYPVLEHILDGLRQNRDRTGGDEDIVADTEVAVTSQDGGNRTNRFLRDDIDNLYSLVGEIKRADYRDDIDQLRNSIDEVRRRPDSRAEIDQIQDMVCDLKRPVDYRDEIDALHGQVSELRRANRTALQLINELVERYDSGT